MIATDMEIRSMQEIVQEVDMVCWMVREFLVSFFERNRATRSECATLVADRLRHLLMSAYAVIFRKPCHAHAIVDNRNRFAHNNQHSMTQS